MTRAPDTNKVYYVYVYLDPHRPGFYRYGNIAFDHEPFYIGKGSGYRKRAHLLAHNIPKGNNKQYTHKLGEDIVRPTEQSVESVDKEPQS